MNEKFFLGCVENFELESRMIETGTKLEMTFSDLSEDEKAEFFNEFYNRIDFNMEDALELTR